VITLATPQELQIAGWVAEFVERELGTVPGPPTERDGQDGSGLTVDFTFDDADPPFVVEVTRLRDDFELWDDDDVRRFKARIKRRAKAKGWPTDWSIGLSPETSFKADLAPAVERMLEWMVAASLDRLGPGSWSADVPMELFQRLQSVKGRDFTKECREARLRGVILVQRLQANGILVIRVVETSDHHSLQRPIARAMGKKASRSLGPAKDRGYVTMLAVDVERKDTRDYLAADVRMWDFPPKIDHLFLFVRKIPGGDLDSAFHANRSREGRTLERLEL
jgi:hypothetical protein